MVSRYNGMRFCDSSASKSDASMWCLYQFVFAMYCVPQRRAFFPHLNFQKCSGPGVLWAFWLRNVLRAKKSRALFQHLNVQKCSGPGLFLTFLTSECASCHSRKQFLISHPTRWLRTCRFSEPTFWAFGATKHWKKHGISRLVYLFAYLAYLSADSFSSLIFFPLAFFSTVTLPASAASFQHIVGSLTSKLPSIKSSSRARPGGVWKNKKTTTGKRWPIGLFWDAEATKCWSCEVHQQLEQMLVEMPLKGHEESMHSWLNESMNQWMDESMSQ